MSKITIYSTTTCPYCVMLKRWLDDRKIKYTEHLVDRDQDAAREMISLSGQMGVPFTTIEDEGGQIRGILGYDVHAFKQVLDLS